MKELKLDLLPGNLYAARRKEQQKEMEKKKKEQQKSIVKIENVSKVDRIDGNRH